MCAMSATRTAPTSRAISAKAGKSMVRGMAVPPQKMIFGRSAQGELADLVHVDPAGLLADAVLHGAEPLAGRGHAPAVGEVAAGRQRHAHDGVAGLEEREVDGEVGGGAGVRLHVGVVDAEQRLGPLDGEGLDLVDDLLALVVALAGVALGVLVGQHRAGRLEHGRRDVVLGRDEAHRVALALGLGPDEVGDLGVGLAQVWVRGGVRRLSHTGSVARSAALVAAPPGQVEGVVRAPPGRLRPDPLHPGARGRASRPTRTRTAAPAGCPGVPGSAGRPGPAARRARRRLRPAQPIARARAAGGSQRRAGGRRPCPTVVRLPRPTRSGRPCSAARQRAVASSR